MANTLYPEIGKCLTMMWRNEFDYATAMMMATNITVKFNQHMTELVILAQQTYLKFATNWYQGGVGRYLPLLLSLFIGVYAYDIGMYPLIFTSPFGLFIGFAFYMVFTECKIFATAAMKSSGIAMFIEYVVTRGRMDKIYAETFAIMYALSTSPIALSFYGLVWVVVMMIR